MFHRVLIGVDGKQGGRDAIALARLLAAQDASFVLGHVVDADGRLAAGLGQVVRRETALAVLRAEREQAGIEASLGICCDRRRGAGLARLAAERDADLIVIGKRNRAALWRLLEGDLVAEMLDDQHCALAVAPVEFTPPEAVRQIAVGYDGTASSVCAVDKARAIAAKRSAELRVVSVLDPDAGDGAPVRLGDAAHLHVLRGEPVTELGRYAGSVDLLVIGTRTADRGPWPWPIGTCESLSQRTVTPLLIVPQPAKSERVGADELVLEGVPHERRPI